MDIHNWKAIIEGLLFAAGDEGLTIRQLSTVLELHTETVEDIMNEMKLEYETNLRGIRIIEIADAYQLATKKEHAPYFKKLMENPSNQTLSQAALETLAIVAYKQPITRAEIEDIRGVKTDRPIQTLVGKLLIREVGRVEGTGRAILYGTTKEFLDYFGLKSIEELPKLPENTTDEFVQEEADLFFEKFAEAFEDLP
ncbi:segregation and condensation protein B [Bacillus mesophilus]|uniref:Segregation and condensation protein B n=1 Tax=Bacillus mesophilus TaxID=1808955 RepID=A0A6M0Q4J8_9BACI|nr:SMC-Scp complex subunit ScpB [Bacillus mesophilus]MBM7661167.1 segregation and condensation protein B [Bacillus mesophilus]NEY71306.1 SMC-Scp complex subunit ScpB [Bacillus mesophilus]